METMLSIAALPALLVLWGILIFNRLVALRNQVKAAWSDIDVQMKRRYNLIPNLVETVKSYVTHEAGTLERVVEARSAAMANQGGPDEQSITEGLLTGALKSLFALSEHYPDLKANQNFLALQNELSDVEDHIQKARRFYNGSVRDLNNKIEQFPSNIVAGMFGFIHFQFFEIDETDTAARQPVKVQF